MTKDQLFAEAQTLDLDERVQLAEALLYSLGDADRTAVDAAWEAEIDRRLAAHDRGDVTSAPPDEMFRRLREKHAR